MLLLSNKIQIELRAELSFSDFIDELYLFLVSFIGYESVYNQLI